MVEDFDVIIIGAGSTGASISYYLSRQKRKILLVDKGGIAGGNTGKSSALIRTHYSNELIASMAKYSYGVISNFDSIGFSGFHKTGMIFPFSKSEEELARENAGMLRGLGLEEEEIPPKAIEGYFPGISLMGFDYVLSEPWSGYADPVAVANSFAQAAQSTGVSIKTGMSVSSVDSNGKAVTVTLRNGNKFTANKVVMATNVWTNAILSDSGISMDRLLPISASLHSVIYLKRPTSLLGAKPVLWDPPNLAYYKMEGDSLCAVGSLDPAIDRRQVDIDKPIPEEAEYEYIEDYMSRLVSRIPAMGESTIISSINGLYDMTPDGQAIISPLDYLGLEGVYVCAGLSGHGFKLSPAYGLITSEMVSGIDPMEATFDWNTFSPHRFAEGKLIRSKFEDIGTIY
ncbi:MAG: NAD(P)/FAD-dependent oxidoreductase [Thermoplasmata archaeon]